MSFSSTENNAVEKVKVETVFVHTDAGKYLEVKSAIEFVNSTVFGYVHCTDWSAPNPQTGISTRQCATNIVAWTETRGGGEV
jgi:hypothetical protein